MAALATIWAAASATAIPPSKLFAREATCAADFSRCSVASFPSYFCCPTKQSCVALAGNTTLLCCPEGSDCSKIAPISCDVTLQDGEKNPKAVVKTTALGGVLPRCGKRCCPFGYSCAGDNQCVMDRNQNAPPASAPASTASTSSATSSTVTATATSATPTTAITETGSDQPTGARSSSPVSSPSGVAAGVTPGVTPGETPSETPSETGSNGPPVAVIAGVTVGVAIAAILGIIVACVLIRRRRKAGDSPNLKLTRSSSSFGNIISNPIVAEGTAMRSDFNRGPAKPSFDLPTPLSRSDMRKPSISSRSSSSSAGRNLTANGMRQSSVAFGIAMPGPPPYGSSPSHPSNRKGDTTLLPQTPRQDQENRELSSVSINVFADPLTLTPESATHAARSGRNSHMTTFTQLMDEADLGAVARGQAYVPYRPDSFQNGSPQSPPPQRR